MTRWCSRCEADALNDPCVCGEPTRLDLERDLEDLEDDIARLRREIDSSDRAGVRVTNEDVWLGSLNRKRARLAVMEHERTLTLLLLETETGDDS